MSRALRISLVLAAVVAAAVAFAVLRPDDDTNAVTEATPQATETPAAADGERAVGDDAVPAATPPPPPPPPPKPPLLTAGSVRRLTVERGETVSFRVRHASEEEVHVHGYDISRALPAGRTITVRFPAELEGIFEIELEQSGTQIASLEVEP